MVFTHNSVTCDSSVLAFLGQFTDLRQVGAWFSLPIQWLATGQYMVFMDNSVTCDRSVFCFLWNFSDWRQVSKGNNKITELRTILQRESALFSLTIQWLATGQCFVFSDLWQVGAWFSLTVQLLATGQCCVFTVYSVTCDRWAHGFLWQFSDLWQVSAWCSLDNPVTYIYKTDHHNINEILLK